MPTVRRVWSTVGTLSAGVLRRLTAALTVVVAIFAVFEALRSVPVTLQVPAASPYTVRLPPEATVALVTELALEVEQPERVIGTATPELLLTVTV